MSPFCSSNPGEGETRMNQGVVWNRLKAPSGIIDVMCMWSLLSVAAVLQFDSNGDKVTTSFTVSQSMCKDD